MFLIEPRMDKLTKIPRNDGKIPQKQLRMKGMNIQTGHQTRNLGRHK